MISRQLPSNDYRQLKAATRDLIDLCGGVRRAAGLTRIDHGSLSRAGSPHEPYFLPIDVVADLEAEAQDAPVSRCLAALSHLDVTARPREQASRTLVEAISGISREAAECVSAMAVSVADGVVDHEEAADILRVAEVLSGEIAKVKAAMRNVVKTKGD